MNKNDANLPPYQALLLDKVNALKAHNAHEKRRRKRENERRERDRERQRERQCF